MEDVTIDLLVDRAKLSRYLDERLGDGPQPIDVKKQVVGYSNETFYINRRAQEYVLRRPPRGPLLPTSHDVSREYRFLSALAGTPARVPRPILFCDDESVIGAPFYLMERKYGVVIVDDLPRQYGPVERRRISEELVRGLVEIHSVDWKAAGLVGKPDGYVERQIQRWRGQAELTVGKVRDLPGLEAISDWLERHKRPSGGSTIVHGDYALNNVMISADLPAKLVAVFDWEMATLGDPLADLGYLMQSWGMPDPLGEHEVPPVTAMPGFLSREEMAGRYAELTGREMRHFAFYHALALWKLAIICEGLYVQYKEGKASNPRSAQLEYRVLNMIRRAERVIESA